LQSRRGATDCSALDIFTAASPLGPWEPHPASPAMRRSQPGDGARMAGRIVEHEGQLYRFGQDSARNYGHRVVAFNIDALTPTEFAQTRVEFESHRPGEGSGAWDSARQHHVDALRLPDGSWLAAVDGDRQMSRPLTRRPPEGQALAASSPSVPRGLVRNAAVVAAGWAVFTAATLWPGAASRVAAAAAGVAARQRRSLKRGSPKDSLVV
jgi:hypothetical protein